MARTLLQPDQIDITELISVIVGILQESGIGDEYPFQFLPTGAIVPFGGGTAPDRFLICDGSSHITGNYPGLFAVIGYTYGGGGANFNVPDLRGRVPAGVGAGSFTALNIQSGAETHTLTMGQMPAHDHNTGGGTAGVTDAQGSHVHVNQHGNTWVAHPGAGGDLTYTQNPGSTNQINAVMQAAGSHGHNVYLNTQGSSAAHNNIQPSIALNFIIAT